MHGRFIDAGKKFSLFPVVRLHLKTGAGRATRKKETGPVSEKVSEKRARESAVAAALGPNAEIGRKLKQYYESLIVEDVPDRFTQLLNQLEKVETRSGKD